MKVIEISEFDELFKEYISEENAPIVEKILNQVWMLLQEKSFEITFEDKLRELL